MADEESKLFSLREAERLRMQVEPILIAEGIPQVVVDLGLVWAELQRPPKALDGLVVLGEPGQGDAQAVVRLGRGRIDRERPADPLDGLGQGAALIVNQAGEVEGAEMRGLAGQNATIDGLGFVQPALPVKGEPLLELGGGIGGAHRPPTLAQNGALSLSCGRRRSAEWPPARSGSGR